MDISAGLAVETIEALVSGNYTPIVQDVSLATPAPKIFSDDCKINWNDTAENIKNFIHGVSPNPGAWTTWHSNRFKIYRAEVIQTSTTRTGRFKITKDAFIVNCKDFEISLKEIQLPGKKLQNIQEFINGYRGDKEGMFED